MGLLRQIREDETLPVEIQIVHAAQGLQHDAFAGAQRLHQQVDFCVMAQRFEMPHAFHGFFDGLFVQDAARVDGDGHPEAVFDDLLQHFDLHFAHQLGADLLQARLPDDAQHGVFLRQLRQLLQRGMDVRAVCGQYAVGEHRFQQRLLRLPFGADGLPGVGQNRAAQGKDLTRDDFLRRLVFNAVIDADLADLLAFFLAVIQPCRDLAAHLQAAAGEFHPGEPCAVVCPGDLEHSSPGIRGPLFLPDAGCHAVQEFLHAVQLKGRSEPAGEDLPLRRQLLDRFPGEAAFCQKFIQRSFIRQRHGLRRVRSRHIDAVGRQFALQQLQDALSFIRASRFRQIHLVDPEEGGHLIALQKGPDRCRVGLYAVRTGNDEDRVIQHGERALHLRGEIHVARGIQQGHPGVAQIEDGLF